ncbi:hypothetical protein BO83DRAFT_396012 [Aspergillus eucalypticola CBS 122712]|uniref:Uncharacterized protein n=1 Tax=Aspergillus eucalypticola (strain CBS 122712 / IBT 29274) TaxID=1448314 RepID=A0A317W520_ASPEC|nr:uncharacterized protein BO83DRAFT_396012 [Aspergillus eucalypticola CBS 122712]PWY81145.1 hypothetical protein BO83DRAFT_396012 [Aspergillus eucalypticola CBS 122712]
MEFDHIAEKKQERKATTWLRLWSSPQPELLSMQLAHKHRPASGKPISACLWKSGAFNICYRTTSIPVPEVCASGICWAGPYIIMSLIEGVPLSKLLKDHSSAGRPLLNPRISNHSLKHAYREMVILVLELSRVEFDSIGALEETEHDCFSITKRPLIFNMNDLMTSANLPLEAFPPPSHTFTSSTDYLHSLATQHLLHLRLQQQKPSITSEGDFQRKLIARYLFQNLTKNLHLTKPPRPLPSLLRRLPSLKQGDLHQFLDRYIPRFHVFLEVLLLGQWAILFVSCREVWFYMFDGIYWEFVDRWFYGDLWSLQDRVRLLSEQRREMDELVRGKLSRCDRGEDEFEDHYPIDCVT